jgi:hypothetical protein
MVQGKPVPGKTGFRPAKPIPQTLYSNFIKIEISRSMKFNMYIQALLDIKKPGAEATGLKMKFSFRNRNSRVVIWYYGITEKSGA